jgi:hypothetical protein
MGRMMMSSGWVFAGIVSIGLVGCSRGNPATDEGPYARIVADAVPKIERTMGLSFKTPPKLEARSREQVREFLERRFNEDTPTRELAGAERAYKRFGMIPDTMQLRPFLLDLLTEQVVGYYDPSTKVLYVVEDAPEDLVGMTVTHELVHALQDQYINLDSIQNLEGNNDRQSALQAVIEGQATYEGLAVTLGNRDFAENIPGGWDRMRDLIRESSSSMPLFNASPMLIQETLIFPYVNGAEFVRRFRRGYPDRVLFDAMPVSTEQVLHASRFSPDSADAPTIITLPETSSGTAVYENNLGEFETRLFLYQHLRDVSAAAEGARGWDGDRYRIVESPAGESLVWATVWDSPIEAATFHDRMQQMIRRRYSTGEPSTAADSARVYRGRDRLLGLWAIEVQGRPAVVFVDAPAGGSVNIIDPRRISLDAGGVVAPEGEAR